MSVAENNTAKPESKFTDKVAPRDKEFTKQVDADKEAAKGRENSPA